MPLDGISVSLAMVTGYALGSLAFGYWVAKANGVDIFAVGSRSPGATNVKRSVGKGAGQPGFCSGFPERVGCGWLAAYRVCKKSIT